ncbi:hypothetical protein BPOR_0189g00110 [Botrytis porri]|uniref:Uncharacterized protein n=1 Tax=Botrytis porri TaxID=87229 RepID=A0A4Z1KU95_9HELO|nr:hypothetical protein BPOR_0189g00110 [Botrytis porri]
MAKKPKAHKKPTPAKEEEQTHEASAHERTSSSGKKRSPRRTKDFGSGAFENGGSPLQRPLSPSTEATEASSKEPKTTGTTRWQLLEKTACLNPGLRIPDTPPWDDTECRLAACPAGLTEAVARIHSSIGAGSLHLITCVGASKREASSACSSLARVATSLIYQLMLRVTANLLVEK